MPLTLQQLGLLRHLAAAKSSGVREAAARSQAKRSSSMSERRSARRRGITGG